MNILEQGLRLINKSNELVYASRKIGEDDTHILYELASFYMVTHGPDQGQKTSTQEIRVSKRNPLDLDLQVIAYSNYFNIPASIRIFPPEERIPQNDLTSYVDYQSVINQWRAERESGNRL